MNPMHAGPSGAIPPGARLSDDALVALMVRHRDLAEQAVMDASGDGQGAACAPSGTVGCAAEHCAAVRRLFDICLQRSAANQSLSRRSRLIPSLFMLFSLPDTAVDERRLGICLHRAFKAVADWRRDAAVVQDRNGRDANARQSGPDKARSVEYDILRCLLEALVYVPEDERDADPDYRYLRDRVSLWQSTMRADGSWPGLPAEESRRRRDILTGYCSLSGAARAGRGVTVKMK